MGISTIEAVMFCAGYLAAAMVGLVVTIILLTPLMLMFSNDGQTAIIGAVLSAIEISLVIAINKLKARNKEQDNE